MSPLIVQGQPIKIIPVPLRQTLWQQVREHSRVIMQIIVYLSVLIQMYKINKVSQLVIKRSLNSAHPLPQAIRHMLIMRIMSRQVQRPRVKVQTVSLSEQMHRQTVIIQQICHIMRLWSVVMQRSPKPIRASRLVVNHLLMQITVRRLVMKHRYLKVNKVRQLVVRHQLQQIMQLLLVMNHVRRVPARMLLVIMPKRLVRIVMQSVKVQEPVQRVPLLLVIMHKRPASVVMRLVIRQKPMLKMRAQSVMLLRPQV